MLTCDEEDIKNDKNVMIENPSIIIEILSDSTEAYERSTKKRWFFLNLSG